MIQGDSLTEQARPVRIQRKRTKGWRMPENTTYVGRPTKWGNPFPISRLLSQDSAYRLFEWLLLGEDGDPYTPRQKFFMSRGKGYPRTDLQELRGRNLACWCPLDQPCHADVLLDLANQEPAP